MQEAPFFLELLWGFCLDGCARLGWWDYLLILYISQQFVGVVQNEGMGDEGVNEETEKLIFYRISTAGDFRSSSNAKAFKLLKNISSDKKKKKRFKSK
jgi:hypothetical protein